VVELGPGDFGTAPPGVPHSFTNARVDQACRVVNLLTPGIGFDRYIAQIDQVAASGAFHDRPGSHRSSASTGPPGRRAAEGQLADDSVLVVPS
jgi:hypothetical protein